jgi:hypothetical protein
MRRYNRLEKRPVRRDTRTQDRVETVGAFGGLTLVDDSDTLIELNEMCNRAGSIQYLPAQRALLQSTVSNTAFCQ